MRITVLCLACAILAGCGSTPSEPTRIPLPIAPLFLTGRYHVQMVGYDFSTDPQIPACDAPIGVPSSGKAVSVDLQVVTEGTEWVGRATASGADIELRFRDRGPLSLGRRGFSGTIRGRARDVGFPGLYDPQDVSVVIGSGSTVEGETAFITTATTLVGRAHGDFRFLDTAGNTGRCSVVSLVLNVRQD